MPEFPIRGILSCTGVTCRSCAHGPCGEAAAGDIEARDALR